MFQEIYEIGDILMVQLKEGIDVDPLSIKSAVNGLLKKYQLSSAYVSNFDKTKRVVIEVENDVENFKELMQQNIPLGGRSKKE